jgi:hypothetical protein
MIQPLRLPPNSYFDDPADKIDRADQAESNDRLIRSLASEALLRMAEWITRGRGGATNRALRADIVVLTIRGQFLPCKRPSAAWVAQEHGISRQRASELWREFAQYMGPYLQFRGQRFLNQRRRQKRIDSA